MVAVFTHWNRVVFLVYDPSSGSRSGRRPLTSAACRPSVAARDRSYLALAASSVADDRVKNRPNKAPEPTPGLVTRRAIARPSSVARSASARLAPSPGVAHL